ncbi:aldo/keto reductase [Amycolatopsis endophytica]|uniref:Aryl-alcohol dehydrogenase-like predicted oxidoreductase n=1 Tax=Amycolatopsis endophytica TaxID=860233 RepID=A0A853B7F8_9PSEU|nr:aldo/keto reductase [Amycolatopsis endophytica]NYI90732.1 aryl-alcohol dehydrogenase-like predicted oxidoreductase [Amycolatopsis endophytica]
MVNELAVRAGVFEVAGKKVPRLGFGSMRLTGRGVWGEPADRDECVAVVRRAVERGVRFIDTADSYGPFVAEEIIRAAIHPYPDEVVIATKAGLTRNGPDVVDTPRGPKRIGSAAWPPLGRPEYLRQQALMSLRRLGQEQLDLFQLHRVDPRVPLADQVGELAQLREEGKVVAIGLSEVSAAQLAEARAITEIATVQNRYNVLERGAGEVLAICERDSIGFIPWAPVAQGRLTAAVLTDVAREHRASVAQIAIAWLLASSPVMLPIPGTSQLVHLDENLGAADIRLSGHDLTRLSGAISTEPAR